MSHRRVALVLVLLCLAAAGAVSAGALVRLPAPVYRTTAVVAGGRIYVLGGHDSAGGTISDVYAVDPSTGRSRRAGELTLPTHGAAAGVLGGRILVFGGARRSAAPSTCSAASRAARSRASSPCNPNSS
jgi:N-acetylneuraminic acid mutarotase